jgi:hypothetical protein
MYSMLIDTSEKFTHILFCVNCKWQEAYESFLELRLSLAALLEELYEQLGEGGTLLLQHALQPQQQGISRESAGNQQGISRETAGNQDQSKTVGWKNIFTLTLCLIHDLV